MKKKMQEAKEVINKNFTLEFALAHCKMLIGTENPTAEEIKKFLDKNPTTIIILELTDEEKKNIESGSTCASNYKFFIKVWYKKPEDELCHRGFASTTNKFNQSTATRCKKVADTETNKKCYYWQDCGSANSFYEFLMEQLYIDTSVNSTFSRVVETSSSLTPSILNSLNTLSKYHELVQEAKKPSKKN